MKPVFLSRVSQPFAAAGSYASHDDRHGRAGHHTGVDFGSLWPKPIEGRAVRSATSGTVVISEFNDTMGNWVGIYDPDDDVTITYWHLSRRLVDVGDRVRKGRRVGIVGSTGNSTAPHLHVQVNPGKGFDYHAHVHPGRWCASTAWWRRFHRRQRAA